MVLAHALIVVYNAARPLQLRWATLELVATGNIAIFDATSAHHWMPCCAEATPVAPDTSLFSGVTTTCQPGAGFQHVEYLPASSARRNRVQAAQPTQLASGRADT